MDRENGSGQYFQVVQPSFTGTLCDHVSVKIENF